MPVTDTQLETILRYFDGELTDAEEQQLMQQLQHNTALQQAFDQQVLMHSFVAEKVLQANETTLESANVFLNQVSSAIENSKAETPVVPVIKRNFRWKVAVAAAVLVCLLGVLLHYFFQNKNPKAELVKIPVKDSLANVKSLPQQPDSTAMVRHQESPLKDSSGLPKMSSFLAQLYADNNEAFAGNGIDVPVMAQPYQNLYERQHYKELAAQNENNLEIKGQADPEEEQETLKCFRFYKALASMQVNKFSQAEELLNSLLLPNSGSGQLNNAARWYLLMVYLKKGDKKQAVLMANLLTSDSDKNNPYYKKAIAIKAALSE